MKQLILTLFICILCSGLGFAGPESARSSGKEMKAVAPAPPPECDFTWTGFYVGLRAGYGWLDNDNVRVKLFDADGVFVFDPSHQSLDVDGFVGGGELGFNWQLGKWFVLGAETDFSGSAMDGSSTRAHDVPQFSPDMANLHVSQDIDWFGTVRGRIGFVPMCKLMIYGTGGFAYASVDDSAVIDFTPFGGLSHLPASHDETDTGWTAGGGIEYAFSRHWSLKVEYLYIDIGDHSAVAPQIPDLNTPSTMARYHWDNAFHTVTGGINFKF